MDEQVGWLKELSCCWSSDPAVAMFPKEAALTDEEAQYIVHQFDYIYGTYADGTDTLSTNEQTRRDAVKTSGAQLNTFRNRCDFLAKTPLREIRTSIGPLSSFAGRGGTGNRAAAPASVATVPNEPNITAEAGTQAAAGSSDDHMPKAATTADKKSIKPTMSAAMKESIRMMQEQDAPYRATESTWRMNLCNECAHKPKDLTQDQLDLLRHKKGFIWCKRMEYGFPLRRRTDAWYECNKFANCLS